MVQIPTEGCTTKLSQNCSAERMTEQKVSCCGVQEATKSRDFPQAVQSASTIVEEADAGESARLQGLLSQWEQKAALEHCKG